MPNIFCISAGQLDSKKKNSTFSRKHRYLNYGLLKLASILGKHDYNPIVIHGLFEKPAHTLELCKLLKIDDNTNPILLSIPSFFALEWAKEFSNQVKVFLPTKKIIVGGRWVVGNNKEWLKSYLNVDLVIPGLVDMEILDIISTLSQRNKYTAVSSQGIDTRIDYRYLYERHLFQPSIEVSNGCGMGCSFCEEKDIKLSVKSR